MKYEATVEQAAEYARLALPQMARHRIAANPINYAVWYEFVSGSNIPLAAAINTLLADNRPLTEEVNEELFREYIGSRNEQVATRLGQALLQIVATVVDSIGHSQASAADLHQALQGYSSRLVHGLDPQEVQTIVQAILAETKAAGESTAKVQERLAATTKELDTMRAELEKVRRQATIDALTGVANRNAFDESLRKAIAELRAEENLSLLFGDIDHFKRFNDAYGHVVGDEALRYVAAIMQRGVRGNDLVARYGGEEFAVLLPDTSLAGALSVAENIRAALNGARLRRKCNGQLLGVVTISIGAAQYRRGEQAERFVNRADAALYWAKAGGRNRVISEIELTEDRAAAG